MSRRPFYIAFRALGARLFTAMFGATLIVFMAACAGEKAPPTLHVSRAYIVVPAGQAPSVMYLTVSNGTSQADTLLRVTSPLSDQVDMHQEMKHTATKSGGMPVGMVHMMPVNSVPIAANQDFHFAPGGHHIMITNPKQPIIAGDSIPITLHFARAGAMEGKAAVITYSDVDTAVTRMNAR